MPSGAPAIRGFATPLRISASLCRRTAKPSRAFALTRGVSRRHAIAEHCLGSQVLSVAYAAMLCFSLALSRGATPSRDIAFQSRRPANLGGAMPSPCHASLCLRQALLIKATPSLPASVHRRCMPRLCFAVALRRAALRCGAVAARGSSWPSYPMPLRIGPLPVMAELPNASAYRSVAGPSRVRAFPCPSFAAPSFAALILRRSSPSCACPSPPTSSLFRRHAMPSQGSSSRRHRNAPLIRRYSGSEPSVHSKRPLPLLRHWPMPRNWP
jgi:hypothetical protein